MMKNNEGIVSKWLGAYRLIPFLVLVGLFVALFHSKLDGTSFVAGLGLVMGAFHLGGAVAARHK